jgi:hypothetical protein
MNTHLTPGVLAARLGAQPHHIAKLIRRGLIPFTRAGRWHLIAVADVPIVRAALVNAGYVPAPTADTPAVVTDAAR